MEIHGKNGKYRSDSVTNGDGWMETGDYKEQCMLFSTGCMYTLAMVSSRE